MLIRLSEILPILPLTQQIAENVEVGTKIFQLTAIDDDINATTLLEFSVGEPIVLIDRDGVETIDDGMFSKVFNIAKDGSVVVKNTIKRDAFAGKK